MRKVNEVLRLFHMAGVSQSEIAGAVGLARSTAQKYIQRASDAGLTWPLPKGMSAEKLDALLFPRSLPTVEAEKGKALPDWERVRHELARKGVTLRLLWLEYLQEHPDGYRYSRFCQFYRAGQAASVSSCVSSTRPARRPSWTSPGRPWRSSIP